MNDSIKCVSPVFFFSDYFSENQRRFTRPHLMEFGFHKWWLIAWKQAVSLQTWFCLDINSYGDNTFRMLLQWYLVYGIMVQSTNKKLHTLELEHGVQLDTCRCFLLLATWGHIVLLAEHCITMTTSIGENREGTSWPIPTLARNLYKSILTFNHTFINQ